MPLNLLKNSYTSVSLQTDIAVATEQLFAYLCQGVSFKRLFSSSPLGHLTYYPDTLKKQEYIDFAFTQFFMPCTFRLYVHSVIEPVEVVFKGSSRKFQEFELYHRLKSLGNKTTILTTTITWKGRAVASKAFDKLLVHAHNILKHDMQQILFPHKKILILGASGFVGSELTTYFRALGHDVHTLKRSDEEWNPKKHFVDLKCIEGFDVIINLCGEPVIGLWTEKKKKKILESRVFGQETLVAALLKLRHPPKEYITASAIGFYGSTDTPIDENGERGSGFLANVCHALEEALRPLQGSQIAVTILRIGVVLSPKGGIIKRLLPSIRLGLGCILGTGVQWISWIALEDLISLINHIITTEGRGVYNAVAPNPITENEFMQKLASHYGRKIYMSCPKPILSLVNKEMAEEILLASQRIIPRKTESSGFIFQYPDFQSWLDSL